MAKKFLQDDRFLKNLLYAESVDMVYLYKDGYYDPLPKITLERTVLEFLTDNYHEKNITMSTVRDVIDQIKLGIYRRQAKEIDTPYIAFTDKLYNEDTFAFEDFDREKIALHHLDMKTTDLTDKHPLWDKFLNQVLVYHVGKPDPELIALVQEMFGFYLLNHMKCHKVFFLVGSGANGKSVMLSMLIKIIGEKFMSAMSIQSLTTEHFATSDLVGKKLNCTNEEESKFMRSDRFKALISGDYVNAERKFGAKFTFRPTTKYIFASNRLPTFDGVNHGIRRRMCIIPFNRVFKDNEQDKELTDKLVGELPGIMDWAIKGAKKLTENNFVFTNAKLTRQSSIDFENETSSALMFFRDNYMVNEDKSSFVENMQLYREYVTWAAENGKKPLSSQNFHSDLIHNIDGLTTEVKFSPELRKTVRGKFIKRLDSYDEGVSMEEAERVIKEM